MAVEIPVREGARGNPVVDSQETSEGRRDWAARPVPAADPADDGDVAADILRRLGEGDAATWAAVTKEYRPRLCAVGRSYRLRAHEAEDAQQRTWSLLWTHADRIRKPGCLGAWLTTTMRHECLSQLRGRRDELVGDWNPLEHAFSGDPSLTSGDPQIHLDQLENSRLARALWELVEELPPRQRDLLRALYAVDEPTYAEISVRTGLPIGAIGPTRQRALGRLRELAERRRPGVAA